MKFTPEEQALIDIFSRDDLAIHRWGFYLAVACPIVAFGLYGFVRSDLVAIGIAFASLIAFWFWYVLAAMRDGKIVAAVLRKVAQAQNDHEAEA